jgi:hypothetical protein
MFQHRNIEFLRSILCVLREKRPNGRGRRLIVMTSRSKPPKWGRRQIHNHPLFIVLAS